MEIAASGTFYRVLYDFNAEDDSELTVQAGVVVSLATLGKSESDAHEGWTLTRCNNKVGFVPSDYLEVVQDGNINTNNGNEIDRENSTLLESEGDNISARSTPLSFVSTGQQPNLHQSDDFLPPQPPVSTVQMNSTGIGGAASSSRISTAFQSLTQSQSQSQIATFAVKAQRNPFLLGSKKQQSQQTSRAGNTTLAVPPLATVVDREDVDELKRLTENYIGKVSDSQKETFDFLSEMVGSLSVKLAESFEASNNIVQSLNELDEMIESEKRKLRQKADSDKATGVLERSKSLVPVASAPAPTLKV